MTQAQQRYRVIERIAAGGMAEVYRAESAGLEGFKKTVAIKRVLPHLAEKKQFIGMFLDEARLSAHLSHSNCVQVFDIGVGDKTYFIVMEFVDGSDLKALLEYMQQHNRKLPLTLALYIACRICDGLSYAHEARDNRDRLLGIVHRDISPPNVLITRYGEVKVVDFGLAKANSQLERSEPGIIKGKFSYLSPEAALGESVDLRTDLFAVGVILWEMLAGRRLFMGETDLQTVRQVQTAEVPDITRFNPEVTPAIAAVLNRALARDPRERYQSARELGSELNRHMFGLGVAVSPFDLANLVTEVVKERQRKKAKTSIIGTLIEDAMMEFTSLEPDGKSNRSFQTLHSTTSSLASRPLDSLGGAQDWAKDLSLEPKGQVSSPFSAGNLAALEDQPMGRPLQPSLPPITPSELMRGRGRSVGLPQRPQGNASPFASAPMQSPLSVPQAPPPPPMPGSFPPPSGGFAPPSAPLGPAPTGPLGPAPTGPSLGDTPQKKRTSNRVVALVVGLVAAAAAAGSYFGGLF